eukprot:2399063-Lingulodinium_polyedra.AAC.1
MRKGEPPTMPSCFAVAVLEFTIAARAVDVRPFVAFRLVVGVVIDQGGGSSSESLHESTSDTSG